MKRFKNIYFSQGYNYADYTPDKSVKLEGGCQGSSLLMACRVVSRNFNLNMIDIAESAKKYGLSFFDLDNATRVSYVTVPIVASHHLSQHSVLLCNTMSVSDIEASSTSSFFAKEANKFYLNMPKLKNLSTLFGISEDEQVKMLVDKLRVGGVAIPLVHPNTLYSFDNPLTDHFIHAVLIYGLSKNGNNLKILDPEPGYSNVNGFMDLVNAGVLKIAAGKLNYEEAKKFAKEHHPMGACAYEVPIDVYKKSLRWCTTIIS